MGIGVMNERGGITADNSPGGSGPVYVAMSLYGIGARTSDVSRLLAVAPATKVTINENTDHVEARMLNGDFAVAVMGHQIVPITISGLDPYGICVSSDGSRWGTGMSVSLFYNRYNVVRNPSLRIAVKAGSSLYRCVMTGLTRSSTGSAMKAAGLGTYSISLIGVKTR